MIERREHGNTIEDLREDIVHREDQRTTALSLTELIVKEGDENWSDDLVNELGPWFMIQLADLANLCESLRKYVLSHLPSDIPLTDQIEVSTNGAFHTGPPAFFSSCPASPSPQPLCLCGSSSKPSPSSWALVSSRCTPSPPTSPSIACSSRPPSSCSGTSPLTVRLPFPSTPRHSKTTITDTSPAEWAINYIQAEGKLLASTSAKPLAPTPTILSPVFDPKTDYNSYTAHQDNTTGRIIVSTSGLRFVANMGHEVLWSLRYGELEALEKQDRVVTKKVPGKLQKDSGMDLKIRSKGGREEVLKNVEERDEAFSQIVGFSENLWQVVW